MALLGAAATLAAAAAPAAARAPLPTIVQDDAVLLHASEPEVAASLDQLHGLGVRDVRVTADWGRMAPAAGAQRAPGIDLTAPGAYPAGAFAALDRLVRIAVDRGMRVLMDVGYTAPAWASGGRGTAAIDPGAYRDFGVALVRRYAGSWTPPGALEPLPAVSWFSLWNEPNHPAFLEPQWRRVDGRWTPASPARYRRMIRAAYPAMKAARPDIAVLVGGTSSLGSYSGRGIGPVAPLRFLRALACVNRRLAPLHTPECRDFRAIPGDGWTHHPYSLRTLPGTLPDRDHSDDVPLAALGRLTATLRALVARGRLAPRLAKVWITEYGYESNPPTRLERWTAGDQARFLAWSEYLAWRNPAVRSFAQFLLRDTPPALVPVGLSKRRPFGDWGSGLLYADGASKPALRGFQAGLFVRRARAGRVLLWGHVRVGTGLRRVRLEVQRDREAEWRALLSHKPGAAGLTEAFATQADGVFERIAAVAPGPGVRYRLRFGGCDRRAGLAVPAVGAAVSPAPLPPQLRPRRR